MLAPLLAFMKVQAKIPKAQIGTGSILLPALTAEFVYRFAP
jgi:hypothetical protein